MRNTARIARELSALVNGIPETGFPGFGENAVFWTDAGDYLYFPSVVLPAGFRQRRTPVLVVVPDGYGRGVPLNDVFVDAALVLADGSRPSRLFAGMTTGLPHDVANRGDFSAFARRLHYPGAIPKLAYLCIHSNRDVTFDEYLEQIYVYLSNPTG